MHAAAREASLASESGGHSAGRHVPLLHAGVLAALAAAVIGICALGQAVSRLAGLAVGGQAVGGVMRCEAVGSESATALARHRSQLTPVRVRGRILLAELLSAASAEG